MYDVLGSKPDVIHLLLEVALCEWLLWLQADDRDAYRRTALHVASATGHAAVVSALIQNGADFDAVDAERDNALHIAAREGHLSVARALLTESRLDAEAINIKGRNPLHVLAWYSRDNAAAICDLFLECMPEYPLDKPDLEGNTGTTARIFFLMLLSLMSPEYLILIQTLSFRSGLYMRNVMILGSIHQRRKKVKYLL